MVVNVVTGAPCSGKTTYIMEHKRDGDLVIDCDLMALALGGDKTKGFSEIVTQAAIMACAYTIRFAAMNKDGYTDNDVWVAWLYLSDDDRRFFDAMGVVWHELHASKETCIARAIADRSSYGRIQNIEKYFKQKEHERQQHWAGKAGEGVPPPTPAQEEKNNKRWQVQ